MDSLMKVQASYSESSSCVKKKLAAPSGESGAMSGPDLSVPLQDCQSFKDGRIKSWCAIQEVIGMEENSPNDHEGG